MPTLFKAVPRQYAIFSALLCLLLLLQGCAQTTSQASNTDKDVFKAAQAFYTQAEAADAAVKGTLGGSAENAIVPLIFTHEGHLLTADEFNRDVLNTNISPTWQTYFTDFATFKHVLAQLVAQGKQNQSRLDDANNPTIAQLPLFGGRAVYAYDPYGIGSQLPSFILNNLNP